MGGSFPRPSQESGSDESPADDYILTDRRNMRLLKNSRSEWRSVKSINSYTEIVSAEQEQLKSSFSVSEAQFHRDNPG